MKQFFVLILICMSTLSLSQEKSKLYGSFTAVGFGAKNTELKVGPSISIGYAIADKFGAGAIVDIFPGKDGGSYGQLAADFRFIMAGINSPVSPFIAVQPGTVLYSKESTIGNTTITTRGSFAFNGMAGVMYRPNKGIGVSFSIGYSTIGFTVKDEETRTNGLRVQLGVAF